MKTAQRASTQAFTEILDIRGNIVLLSGNNACIVIRVTSVNFSLLSGQEQDAKVFAYAALLNSLSFPIQILIRSKPIQIEPYLDTIELRIQNTASPELKSYMEHYKNFVKGLVKEATVLDKQFYIVIPYSGLEAGATSLITRPKNGKGLDVFFEEALASLTTKAESLLEQLHRLSLQVKILEKDELTKLFYDVYNQGESLTTTTSDTEKPMVKGVS